MTGPVVAGKIVDSCCKIWNSSCHGQGACALYDSDDFRFKRHIVEIGGKIFAIILYTIVLILARKKTDWSTDSPNAETEIISAEEEKLVHAKDPNRTLQNGFESDPIVKKKIDVDPTV